MKIAQKGDVVKVHYTGKHTTGQIFDSSIGQEPLAFVIGEGQMIPGFENGILGMATGSKKTIQIPFMEAYGEAYPELIMEVDRAEIPQEIPLELGMPLNVQTAEGQPATVFVVNLTDTHVTLDANHPLAGKDLIFEVEVVEVSSQADQNKKPLFFN